MLLADGNRQIPSLHLPGDLAGEAALAWAQAPFALTAATDAVVHVIDKVVFRSLFERQPRLAMLLHALAQVERVALSDRLASIGRTPAKARVATLIVDALRRLRAYGGQTGGEFSLPLTQEESGDVTGLTAVHVNRMMRLLVEDGLIARTNGCICVLDEDRLAQIARPIDRYQTIDTRWLPPAPAG